MYFDCSKVSDISTVRSTIPLHLFCSSRKG
jgi:hypothetical protein